MHKPIKLVKILISLIVLYTVSTSIHANKTSVGGEFELTAHTGEQFKLSDIKGKVGVIFFGFTHCPDVCPNTLLEIQRLLVALQDHSDSLQVLFISVDPKRDTPEILKSYVHYFNKDIIGLTGTEDEINHVLDQYNGKVSFSGDLESNNYSVDHVANMYLIDKKGDIGSIILPRTPYAVLEQQVRKLIAQ